MIRLFACLLALLLTATTAFAADPVQIPITQTDENTLLISLAGDCCLGSENKLQDSPGQFVKVIGELGLEHPFSGVKQIFEADDLTLVNLENTFTTRTRGQNKRYIFRAPLEYAEILSLGSVEAVNLANNHTVDFFDGGLTDTKLALDTQGIAYSDFDDPKIVEVKGVKIGLLGCAAPRGDMIDQLIAQKETLRAQGATVFIASMHWGHEYYTYQNDTQTKYARQLIDGGFDIVVGHHPHVLQGVEYYKGKPIFYSLGNFSFGGNRNPRDWDTMIAQVSFDLSSGTPRLSEIRLIPCVISDVTEGYQDFRPVPVVGTRAQKILEKVAKYSVGYPDTFYASGRYQPGVVVAARVTEARAVDE